MTDTIELEGYRDVELIGRGGLGDVYRACRESTGGVVACKVIRSDGDPDSVRRRLDREVAALVQLKGHPFVVQIEEVLDSPYGPIVVMEHAANGSLFDRVRSGGRLSPAEYVLALEHVSVALRDAHARGIVHRDVKPHNLLVGDFGQVKVCDFGIAVLARSEGIDDRTSALSYRYASPEELDDSSNVGPPADVYSLGVTIRHLATGVPTRSGPSDALAAWLGGLDALDTAVAEAVQRLVASMVRTEPADRPTMRDIVQRADEIGACLRDRRQRQLVPLPVASDGPAAPVGDSGAAVMAGSAADDDVTMPRQRAAVPSLLTHGHSPWTTRKAGLPRPDDSGDRWW